MSNEDRPSDIRFADDRGDQYPDNGNEFLEQDDHEVEETVDRTPRKKKGGSKLILVVGIVVLLLAILGFCYAAFTLLSKSTGSDMQEMGELPVQSSQAGNQVASLPPQPQIQQSVPLEHELINPQPGVWTAQQQIESPSPSLSPLPEQKAQPIAVASVAAVGTSPSIQPVQAVAPLTPTYDPVSKVDMSSEIQAVHQRMTKLEGQLADLIKTVKDLSDLSKRETARASVGSTSQKPAAQNPKPTVAAVKPVATAQKPSPKTTPKPAAPAPAAPLNEVIVSTVRVRDEYRVSAMVNNRAFITRRTADGDEVEQSVTVGDRLGGIAVVEIKGAERQVVLQGGRRITSAWSNVN